MKTNANARHMSEAEWRNAQKEAEKMGEDAQAKREAEEDHIPPDAHSYAHLPPAEAAKADTKASRATHEADSPHAHAAPHTCGTQAPNVQCMPCSNSLSHTHIDSRSPCTALCACLDSLSLSFSPFHLSFPPLSLPSNLQSLFPSFPLSRTTPLSPLSLQPRPLDPTHSLDSLHELHSRAEIPTNSMKKRRMTITTRN